jgi:VWFA-related protein
MSSYAACAQILAAMLACIGVPLAAQQGAEAASSGQAAISPQFTLRTSVDRVLVDVTVTGAHGAPVHGLTRDDFTVEEDGQPQTVLSFDAYNFDTGMEYVPPNLPPMQPNTFVNLPASPERGPLYVLLYDLVNIPQEDQAYARAQLIKFIKAKPAGARFAIFVSSDGVHLVQGFTSDRQKLLAAVDVNGATPHVPEIFLMGANFGRGDRLAASARLASIARYLAPMAGRKNLIWFASQFPLSLLPIQDDTDAYREEVKATIDLLADTRIAVYPVDVSGVVVTESYAPSGDAGGAGITSDDRQKGIPSPGTSTGSGGASPPPSKGPGYSLLAASYMAQDEIARMTGGEAVYSSNNLVGALERVTGDGGSYYTLAYSPSNKQFNGHLRRIEVRLKEGKYRLSYRRAYYGVSRPSSDEPANNPLSASMKYGAPEDHRLIFGVHLALASPDRSGEQRINLSKPGNRKSSKTAPAQAYTIDYTVMAQQLRAAGDTAPHFAIAAAVYDADGRMLSSVVNEAVEFDPPAAGQARASKAYRMGQHLDAPAGARFMRFAVRDLQTGKTGAMEITLPLAPAN